MKQYESADFRLGTAITRLAKLITFSGYPYNIRSAQSVWDGFDMPELLRRSGVGRSTVYGCCTFAWGKQLIVQTPLCLSCTGVPADSSSSICPSRRASPGLPRCGMRQAWAAGIADIFHCLRSRWTPPAAIARAHIAGCPEPSQSGTLRIAWWCH